LGWPKIFANLAPKNGENMHNHITFIIATSYAIKQGTYREISIILDFPRSLRKHNRATELQSHKPQAPSNIKAISNLKATQSQRLNCQLPSTPPFLQPHQL
jgi:hypothetical protein